jgi:hypothetical protein
VVVSCSEYDQNAFSEYITLLENRNTGVRECGLQDINKMENRNMG